MSQRANYFKIGLFILGATAVALVGLLALGAGNLFQPKFYAETYFEESVQGLDIGSPIKFRGVQVGKVKEITLVGVKYDTEKRYVLVRVSLFSKAFGAFTAEEVEELVKTEVEKGLRVKLAFQGVTGAAYLEADYFDDEKARWLTIDWQPEYAYIPSTPSTITRYTEAIDKIVKNIEQADIEALIASIEKALSGLNRTTEEARIGEISNQAIPLLAELRATNQRFAGLIAQAEGPLGQVFKELPETVDSLNRLTGRLNEMAGELPAHIKPLGKTLHRLNGLLSAEHQNIQETLDNLHQVSINLRELTESARDYPSQIIFGEPPPTRKP